MGKLKKTEQRNGHGNFRWGINEVRTPRRTENRAVHGDLWELHQNNFRGTKRTTRSGHSINGSAVGDFRERPASSARVGVSATSGFAVQ